MRAVLVFALLLSGCSCDDDMPGTERDAGGGMDGTTPGLDTGIPGRDGAVVTDGDGCEAPDMLIVLDRTMSMHRRPDGTPAMDSPAGRMESKWWTAVVAIETFTADLDDTIRFGLELFPRDPGGDACVTLSQRIGGTRATNPQCEGGEVVVSPMLDSSGDIAAAIDPETSVLCRSTPIGAALDTATGALSAIASAGREQYVLLITDGQNTCDGAGPVAPAQTLAAMGVNTYVIGFDSSSGGSGIDRPTLNDVACAGHTAPDFETNCMDTGGGAYRAVNPSGADLFLVAGDAAGLTTALEAAAGEVCCGCLI